jgi:DNA repair exonuclease SbcCD ATPase subunit
MIQEADKVQVRQELDALRRQGARRQALSWHACHRLFFDFGIKPSVVAVRELTGTGSASDIPRDIASFWAQVRDASQLRAAQGAIPATLELRAGELLGALYQSACDTANQQIQQERDALAQKQQADEQRVRAAELETSLANRAAALLRAQLDEQTLRREQAEQRLAVLQGELALRAEHADAGRSHREQELEALQQRLSERDAALAELRAQYDVLRSEAQANAEHYAAQLKSALDDAQRRVRPMLLELDNLRAIAATHQQGVKEAGRREFEFMQQLSLSKGRAQTLEKLADRQADELAALHRELAVVRERGGAEPHLAQLIADIAARGVLEDADWVRLGRTVDGYATVPGHCHRCAEGEPELTEFDGHIELACPECGHSSGACGSRIEACCRFSGERVPSS